MHRRRRNEDVGEDQFAGTRTALKIDHENIFSGNASAPIVGP